MFKKQKMEDVKLVLTMATAVASVTKLIWSYFVSGVCVNICIY